MFFSCERSLGLPALGLTGSVPPGVREESLHCLRAEQRPAPPAEGQHLRGGVPVHAAHLPPQQVRLPLQLHIWEGLVLPWQREFALGLVEKRGSFGCDGFPVFSGF